MAGRRVDPLAPGAARAPAEHLHAVAVIAVQPRRGAEPHEATAVLQDAHDPLVGEAVLRREMTELEALRSPRHRPTHQARSYQRQAGRPLRRAAHSGMSPQLAPGTGTAGKAAPGVRRGHHAALRFCGAPHRDLSRFRVENPTDSLRRATFQAFAARPTLLLEAAASPRSSRRLPPARLSRNGGSRNNVLREQRRTGTRCFAGCASRPFPGLAPRDCPRRRLPGVPQIALRLPHRAAARALSSVSATFLLHLRHGGARESPRMAP